MSSGTATVSEAKHHKWTCLGVPPHAVDFARDSRLLVAWNVTNRCNLRRALSRGRKPCVIRSIDREG